MASFSVPCPKISVLSVASSSNLSSTHQPQSSLSFRSGPALLPRIQVCVPFERLIVKIEALSCIWLSLVCFVFQGSSRIQSQVFKVNAQLNEVILYLLVVSWNFVCLNY